MCTLECLKLVLEKEGLPSKAFSLDHISDNLIKEVKETFNLTSWGRQGSALFRLLLALAGIPVMCKSVISKPGTPCAQQVTMANLKRAGLVHLCPHTQSQPCGTLGYVLEHHPE